MLYFIANVILLKRVTQYDSYSGKLVYLLNCYVISDYLPATLFKGFTYEYLEQ